MGAGRSYDSIYLQHRPASSRPPAGQVEVPEMFANTGIENSVKAEAKWQPVEVDLPTARQASSENGDPGDKVGEQSWR